MIQRGIKSKLIMTYPEAQSADDINNGATTNEPTAGNITNQTDNRWTSGTLETPWNI
jgi:hypothetical protein